VSQLSLKSADVPVPALRQGSIATCFACCDLSALQESVQHRSPSNAQRNTLVHTVFTLTLPSCATLIVWFSAGKQVCIYAHCAMMR